MHGQTIALEMLFVPEAAMLSTPHSVWYEIKRTCVALIVSGFICFLLLKVIVHTGYGLALLRD